MSRAKTVSQPPRLMLAAALWLAAAGAAAAEPAPAAAATPASAPEDGAANDKAADKKAGKAKTLHVTVLVAELETDPLKPAAGATVYLQVPDNQQVVTGKDGSAKIAAVAPGKAQLVVLAVNAPKCQLTIDTARAAGVKVLVLKSGC